MSDPHHPDRERLIPDEPLPPYSYVTGRFPHPTGDPAGHSYGHAPPESPPFDPRRWQDSRAYLWGCDLFNHGYYWEAHETWESLWNVCGRRGPAADFLKGLIKLAAAGVKAREGRAGGVRRHFARAAQLFRSVRSEAGASYAGLDLAHLIQLAGDPAGALVDDIHHLAASRAPVELAFGFQLRPRG
jgi:hypothetical protein